LNTDEPPFDFNIFFLEHLPCPLAGPVPDFDATHVGEYPGAKDFQKISEISDRLLGHYTEAWKDRQVYYQARQRARSQSDLLVMILDSFDKCKMSLPRWKFGRTPKRPIYEAINRILTKKCMKVE